jgi:hypothetical protein
MIDITLLQSILNSIIGVVVQDVDALRLPGDAGNRTYYRVSWKSESSLKSLILMVLASPEGFKKSEEAVSGTDSPITELPFINIHRHFESCHVRVPKIFHYDSGKGWLLLEDLGDAMLADVVAKYSLDSQPVLDIYQKAIDTLIHIQRFATPQNNTTSLAHCRAFDQALFVWEFDHFIEYGIEKVGVIISERDKGLIRGAFADIALRLATLPQVFTHRDYHSRNLMIQSDTICVIDFQDALMGPREYDLASLLRDSYIDLPEPVIDRLISYYIAQWELEMGERINTEPFREIFDLISIQRNLKAAGRFVYINQVKKNPKFLAYVPPTLAKVKRNLEKHKRLKPLQELLSKYVKELQ